MKIGSFIPEFPGQTHSFFWREIVELERRHGIQAAILSTRRPARPVEHEWVRQTTARYLYPVSTLAMLGLLFRVLPILPRLLLRRDVWRLLVIPRNWGFVLMAVRLQDLCRAERVDHLHVHSCANAALVAAFSNRLYGLTYSLVLHGPLSDYGPHQDFKWTGASFAFVITEKLRREIAAIMPYMLDRLVVVPMGVDTERFSPPAVARPPDPECFRWFCCARLNRVKGHDTLIKAVAALRGSDHTLRFSVRIAGEDEQGGTGYRKEIEKLIASHGLQDVVILLGAVSQAVVLAELQAADGFVLASRHEPLGVAYMEAMACGLPTLGTRAGGVAELMDDGHDSLLAEPDDPAALAIAMRTIMTDPELRSRMGQAARHKIVSAFGASRSADALAERLVART